MPTKNREGMCDVVGKTLSQVPAASRRRFLQGLSAATVAGSLVAAGTPAVAAAATCPGAGNGKGAAKGHRTKRN